MKIIEWGYKEKEVGVINETLSKRGTYREGPVGRE